MSFPRRYRAPKNTFWSVWNYISEKLDTIDSQFFWTMIENLLQHLLHFELLLWKKGRNSLTLFQNLRNLTSWIDDLVLDLQELRISISKSGKLWEKRYSSSLKVVKETVRKCSISQKSWCIESDIRNFRDKNGDAWKSFDFFDTQIKTPSGSDYACSRESTFRSVPLLPFDPISIPLKFVMQILY